LYYGIGAGLLAAAGAGIWYFKDFLWTKIGYPPKPKTVIEEVVDHKYALAGVGLGLAGIAAVKWGLPAVCNKGGGGIITSVDRAAEMIGLKSTSGTSWGYIFMWIVGILVVALLTLMGVLYYTGFFKQVPDPSGGEWDLEAGCRVRDMGSRRSTRVTRPLNSRCVV